MDNLGNVAEKVGPALLEFAKQKQQQPVYQPQQLPPQAEQPQEILPQQPNPEPPKSSELTPTEQQMSDQYSEMYLHSSDKNKK